jgi:hypothetical protein
VFHTSLLQPYHKNSIPGRVQKPPPPVIVDGEKEYEIEKILDSKVSRNRLKFLVRWKGYTAESDEWIDKDYLENSQGLISEFNKRQKQK